MDARAAGTLPFSEGRALLPEVPSRSWWRWLLALFIPPRGQRNRPTVSGWLLILVALGIGVAAYNTASNILFLVLSFVFALLIVNGVLSTINFRGLDWEMRLPTECRAGEVLSGSLTLRNRKRLFSTRAVWFVLRAAEGAPHRVRVRERVGPGGTVSVPFTFGPAARGRIAVRLEGPESTFPFGFLRKQTGAFAQDGLLVWPAADPRAPRAPDPRRTVRLGGVRRRAGSGTDLMHLREYLKGDPLRRVHWKATARTGRLVVRQLADEGTGCFRLSIELSDTIWPDADIFERFLSRVSAVAGSLFRESRLDGYEIDSGGFEPVRHAADLKKLNDTLALAAPTGVRAGDRAWGAGNWLRFRPTADGGVAVQNAE